MQMQKSTLSTTPDADRKYYLETLKSIEPFCNFAEEIDKAIKKGEIQ